MHINHRIPGELPDFQTNPLGHNKMEVELPLTWQPYRVVPLVIYVGLEPTILRNYIYYKINGFSYIIDK
jgi:hypothetical protein